jgi:hypothetical protein
VVKAPSREQRRRRPAVPAWAVPSIAAVSTGSEPPEVAAERARERLHEEIDHVRAGVEEMLSGQGGDAGRGRINRLEERLFRLEGRLDQVEQERRHAEWRIYTGVEAQLDNVLREMRIVADRLSR